MRLFRPAFFLEWMNDENIIGEDDRITANGLGRIFYIFIIDFYFYSFMHFSGRILGVQMMDGSRNWLLIHWLIVWLIDELMDGRVDFKTPQLNSYRRNNICCIDLPVYTLNRVCNLACLQNQIKFRSLFEYDGHIRLFINMINSTYEIAGVITLGGDKIQIMTSKKSTS